MGVSFWVKNDSIFNFGFLRKSFDTSYLAKYVTKLQENYECKKIFYGQPNVKISIYYKNFKFGVKCFEKDSGAIFDFSKVETSDMRLCFGVIIDKYDRNPKIKLVGELIL